MFRRCSMLVLALLLALTVVACGPEADRELGEGRGSGADVGNRDAEVEMHGDEPGRVRMYYDTPIHDVASNESEEEDDDD